MFCTRRKRHLKAKNDVLPLEQLVLMRLLPPPLFVLINYGHLENTCCCSHNVGSSKFKLFIKNWVGRKVPQNEITYYSIFCLDQLRAPWEHMLLLSQIIWWSGRRYKVQTIHCQFHWVENIGVSYQRRPYDNLLPTIINSLQSSLLIKILLTNGVLFQQWIDSHPPFITMIFS